MSLCVHRSRTEVALRLGKGIGGVGIECRAHRLYFLYLFRLIRLFHIVVGEGAIGEEPYSRCTNDCYHDNNNDYLFLFHASFLSD